MVGRGEGGLGDRRGGVLHPNPLVVPSTAGFREAWIGVGCPRASPNCVSLLVVFYSGQGGREGPTRCGAGRKGLVGAADQDALSDGPILGLRALETGEIEATLATVIG